MCRSLCNISGLFCYDTCFYNYYIHIYIFRCNTDSLMIFISQQRLCLKENVFVFFWVCARTTLLELPRLQTKNCCNLKYNIAHLWTVYQSTIVRCYTLVAVHLEMLFHNLPPKFYLLNISLCACTSVLAAVACGQVVLSEPCNVSAQALDVLTSSVRLCQH